jgi:hypothetical protein
MKNYHRAWLIGLTLISVIAGCHRHAPATLEEELRSTYTAYVRACKRGDIRECRKLMSAFSVLELKGYATSSGRRFDKEYVLDRSSFIVPPPLDGLKPLATRQNGDTAKLILYGRPKGSTDSGNMRIVPSFHVIDFLREDDHWKVHFVGGAIPSMIPSAEERIVAGDFSSILTNALFFPSGSVPALPKEVPSIDAEGMWHVNTGGYVTEVWINGFHQRPRKAIIDSSSIGTVFGGLKFGENSINVEIRRFLGESCYGNSPPAYALGIALERQPDKWEPVFTYGPTNAPSSFSTTFTLKREAF